MHYNSFLCAVVKCWHVFPLQLNPAESDLWNRVKEVHNITYICMHTSHSFHVRHNRKSSKQTRCTAVQNPPNILLIIIILFFRTKES